MAVGFTRQEKGLVATAAFLVFSRVFGLSLTLPNFRGHYEAEFAVDAVWIGTAFAAYGLTMALMQLPNGILSDRFGRRPLLWSGSLFFVGGSLLAAIADDIALLIVARLLQGMGAVASVATATVGESVPAKRRTTAMAFVGIPAGAGFFVGIAAGPLLFPAIGMEGLFLVTAGVGALAALPLMWIRVQQTERVPSAAPRPWRPSGAVLALAAGGFATNYLLTTTLFLLPDDDWRTLLPLLGFALVGVVVVSRGVDRAGWTWQPVATGLAFVGGAAALYTLTGPPWWWIGGGLFFLLHAALSTTLPSQVSRIAGRQGGRGHGVQNVVAYAGTFAAGPVAGLLAKWPEAAIALADILSVAAAITVVLALRRDSPKASS